MTLLIDLLFEIFSPKWVIARTDLTAKTDEEVIDMDQSNHLKKKLMID
jgi:hypothetical protein